MKTEVVKISKVKANKNNPRIIKDEKFKSLVKSIKEFPEMLKIRPIVVDNEMVVLGGNMRLKACKEAGLTEVQIIKASENSALTSHALVLLAKHYSEHEAAQNYLLAQLIDEQNKWHAASAMSYVNNDQFQQRIFKLRQDSPSPAINFASELIMQESQQ